MTSPCLPKSSMRWSTAVYRTYWVDFQIPGLPGLREIDNDLFIWQSQFLDCDERPMRIRAVMVGVEGDLGRVSVYGRHTAGFGY